MYFIPNAKWKERVRVKFFVLNSLVPYRLVREGAEGECTNVNILFNTDMLTFSNMTDGNKT